MGSLLLFLQVGLIFFQFLFSDLISVFLFPHLLLLFIVGIGVALWGFFSLGRSYSPLPKPKEDNQLSQRGVYRFIRHPIYTGLFLICLSFLLSRIHALSIITFGLVVYITNKKANLEEDLLIKKHPTYKTYRKSVRKFFPFDLS